MTSRTQIHAAIALGAVLLFPLFPVGPVAAENPGPASAAQEVAPPPSDAPDAEREAYWRVRAQEARDRVAAAQERVAESGEDYGRMRHRNRKRGEARQEISEGRDAAHAELEAALHYMNVELPEEARRAGALPGWLRE